MSDWRPIETAPRDGTPVLGWGGNPQIGFIRWWAQAERWGDSNTGERHRGVTHWMPLPDPPDSESETEKDPQ